MSLVPSTRLGVGPALLIGLIGLYRYSLGLFIGGRCRFHPSCSVYAEAAIRSHGALGGSWLAFRRLLRCHPWNPGGVDRVPEVMGQYGSRP